MGQAMEKRHARDAQPHNLLCVQKGFGAGPNKRQTGVWPHTHCLPVCKVVPLCIACRFCVRPWKTDRYVKFCKIVAPLFRKAELTVTIPLDNVNVLDYN